MRKFKKLNNMMKTKETKLFCFDVSKTLFIIQLKNYVLNLKLELLLIKEQLQEHFKVIFPNQKPKLKIKNLNKYNKTN